METLRMGYMIVAKNKITGAIEFAFEDDFGNGRDYMNYGFTRKIKYAKIYHDIERVNRVKLYLQNIMSRYYEDITVMDVIFKRTYEEE